MKTVQIAVIGGGASGLAAAIAAADAGAQVLLVEEHPTLGGRLRYHLGPFEGTHGPVSGPARAAELIAEAKAAGVEMLAGTACWGRFADNVLGLQDGTRSWQLKADRIVVAAGSTDRALPFPGWSLPGVMSARALLLLLHVHRVLPGKRFAIVGNGAGIDELAHAISMAGGEVVARTATVDGVAAEGARGVTQVTIAGTGHAVDCVAIAGGAQPDAGLTLMAEAAHGHSDLLGGFAPLRNEDMLTTADGVYVAGEAGGICPVPVAEAEGRVAGNAAARSLGLGSAAELDRAKAGLMAVAAERVAHVAALPIAHRQLASTAWAAEGDLR